MLRLSLFCGLLVAVLGWPTRNVTTTEDPRWAVWDEDEKWDMMIGFAMGAGVMVGTICLTIIVICFCCKNNIDNGRERAKQVRSAEKQKKYEVQKERRLARVPGVSNEIVSGYAGGIRDSWNPWNF